MTAREPEHGVTGSFCEKCGRSVTAGAQFCANCGANVSDVQGSVATKLVSPASLTAQMHDLLLEQLREAALGEYEILTELGRGGMATVYLAHDLQLDRKVAIKVMLPALLEGEGMVERFKLEARTAAQLSHPHIIPIFAVRDHEQLLFFVMKFIEGRPLDSIVEEMGKVPITLAQAILAKVGDALGYAHRRGVVHRDIKPANIMIDTEGQPVVTDFGIAKVSEQKGLTMTGATVGTPTYMSPEQCAAGTITGASDQYSLGVVAYEMLAGRTPFPGESIISLMYKHVHEPPPPFMDERPDCPPALHDAVMRMLGKTPAERFPSLELAVQAIGNVSLAFDDPLRVQLVDLAKKGTNLIALKRVSTPRSPTPLRTKSTRRNPMAEQKTALTVPPEAAATVVGATAATAPGRPSRLGWIVAAVVLAAAGLGVYLKPWARPVAPPAAPATAAATLALQPGTGSLQVGGTLQMGASVLDSTGAMVSAPITWTSDNPQAASVSPGGLVQALAAGVASITATSGAARSSAAITVTAEPAPAVVTAADPPGRAPVSGRAPPVAQPTAPVTRPTVTAVRAASVAVSAAPGALTVGGSTRLTATVQGDDGRPMNAAVIWRSADPGVATVSDGVVTGIGAGSTIITAAADGREGNTTVRVTAPEVSRPVTPVTPTVTVEPRDAVAAVIQDYARALESKSLAQVRRVYPGMTSEQQNQFEQTLRTLDQLRVRLRIGNLDLQETEATAAVSGEYEFFSRENRRTERLPVRFRATLEQVAGTWRIRSIQ